MRLSLVLALALLAAAPCTAASRTSTATPTPPFTIVLRFHAGDRIVQHSDLVDRIAWWLPHQRLEAFRAQGIVINEEMRTSSVATGVVTRVSGGVATIRAQLATTVHDVPRSRTKVSHDAGVFSMTVRNAGVAAALYDIQDAPMTDLPATPVRLGSRWTTREHVLTTLGSGAAVFQHVVADIDGPRVRIDVTGSGTITGKEYNLPWLLPGTIAVSGSAWFNLENGLIERESYRIQNGLVKPARSERIGFTEVLDVDVDAYKETPAASPKSLTRSPMNDEANHAR